MKTITKLLLMMAITLSMTITAQNDNLSFEFGDNGTIEKAIITATTVEEALDLNLQALAINQTQPITAIEISLSVLSQTDIRGLLETLMANPISSGLLLGCCVGDPDNHVDINEELCVYQYYRIDLSEEAGGDLLFTGSVTNRQSLLSIVGSGNLILDNGIINNGTDNCPGDLLIEEGSNLYNSVAEYDTAQETLSVDDYTYNHNRIVFLQEVDFVLYNVLGKEALRTKSKQYSFNQFAKGVYFINYIFENKINAIKIIII